MINNGRVSKEDRIKFRWADLHLYVTANGAKLKGEMRLLLAILLLSIGTFGATYRGENIDGKSYGVSVKAGGLIRAGSIIFHGKSATITIDRETYDVKLASEMIDDPAEDRKSVV